MSEALRFNDGKLRYDLINPIAEKGLVKVLTKGAEKYSPKNWEKGMSWSKVIASLKRHLAAIEACEDYDVETNLLHADHIQANSHFLSAYYAIAPEFDDREHWFKKPIKKVYLDIDGILCGFEEHFLNYLNLPKEHPTDWFDYRFRENFHKIANDNEFWLSAPSLIQASELKYPIAGYCTTRTCDDSISKEWLYRNGFPEGDFINVKTDGKLEALKGKCDVFVDDSIYNFSQLQANGILCYLMSRPHNLKYNVGMYRVNTFTEFINNLFQL